MLSQVVDVEGPAKKQFTYIVPRHLSDFDRARSTITSFEARAMTPSSCCPSPARSLKATLGVRHHVSPLVVAGPSNSAWSSKS